MSSEQVLGQLRRFLLVLSLVIFVGGLVELWLVGHTEDAIQWIAFALCGIGGLAAVARLLKPNAATLWILRVSMLAVIVGSMFGVYEHLTGNLEFEREIQANAATSTLLWKALKGGSPLLAPGILVIAAILAVSATYRHEAPAHETP